MAGSELMENLAPRKKQRLDKASGESNSGSTQRQLRKYDPYDDEYIRQYLLYYYQFHKSEVWPYPVSQIKTNDEVIRDVACRAISQHNEDKGSRLVFVDHVSASYMWSGGVLYWITFWAMDLGSSNPHPKLYQTNVRRCGPTFCEIIIFRLKPTDEEIAAVQVDPPPPLYDDDPELPTILFTVTGPGSGDMSIPEVAFTRFPAEVESVWYP